MPANDEFARLDRHVLRVAHGALIDVALHPAAGSQMWIATMWLDLEQTGVWRRLVWDRHPTGRGWTIHPLTHIADLIEFGADDGVVTDRWYGYLAHATDTHLVIVGPFPTPGDAAEDATVSLTQWRRAVS